MNINGVFNPQNKFWSFMDKIMDICILSLIWFLFSLPIVTIGAATTALFQFTLKATANEEGYVFRSFLKAFRQDFIPSTLIWIGGVGMFGFLCLDVYFIQKLVLSQWVRWGFLVGLGSIILVFLLTMIWVFPLLAFFRFSIKKVITHGFIMAMGNLYVSITILVIYLVATGMTWFAPPLFMIWFGLASFFSSYFFRYVFFRYMESTEKENLFL